jgi:hypothetical protein
MEWSALQQRVTMWLRERCNDEFFVDQMVMQRGGENVSVIPL